MEDLSPDEKVQKFKIKRVYDEVQAKSAVVVLLHCNVMGIRFEFKMIKVIQTKKSCLEIILKIL